MNIEEAIKILKKAKEPYYTEVVGSKWIKGYTTILGTEVDKAIDIILNELDKKDKVINLMAGNLTTDYHDISWVEDYYYNMAQEILEK